MHQVVSNTGMSGISLAVVDRTFLQVHDVSYDCVGNVFDHDQEVCERDRSQDQVRRTYQLLPASHQGGGGIVSIFPNP